MRAVVLAAVLVCGLNAPAVAWGPEGHSVVGEIAQRRSPRRRENGRAGAGPRTFAGSGRELGRQRAGKRPATANWHFVDIPVAAADYDKARDCAARAERRLRGRRARSLARRIALRAVGEGQVEALKFAVHFVGDIHQPLHTVGDAGGNGIKVDVFMRGQKNCGGACELDHMASNFDKASRTAT